ncbi:Hpt domain-containing protein [Aquimarina rhabdastrellae]
MEKRYSLEKIKELAGDDQEFITVLVQTFLEEIPEDMHGMVSAVEANDAEKAYQCAHKMKPNLQLFDVDLLSYIKEMESWSKSNKNKEDIQPILTHITKTITEVLKQLENDFA